MRRLVALLMVAGALCAGVAGAQTEGARVKCIGDSITAGKLPFDEEDAGGYPARLQPLLRMGGMRNARVENHGVGGDDTFEILARIGGVVPGSDVLVVLGGTNDVDDIVAGRFLLDDTLANLDFMIDFAQDRGVRTILGTITPRSPNARRDSGNSTTYQLLQEIRSMAHNKSYELVDFWDALPFRERSTYSLYYYPGNEDVIGHPNAAGFALMAEVAAGVILEGDVQRPVEGRLRQPTRGVRRVNASTDYEMEMYDFDSGIQLSSATLLLNGEPLETTVTGSPRKAVLFAPGDGRGRCKATLSMRASDRAEPPNEVDFFIFTFDTPRQLIAGDINGDCRVDGRDLALFGPGFGLVRTDKGFNGELDLVANGAIDGDDFARLANNFGRGELAGAASE